MTMERFDALKRLPENQNPKSQFAIEAMGHLFTSAGIKDLGPKTEDPGVPKKVEESQPITTETVKIYPEISLEQEWQRQADRLLELGFHKELIVDGKRIELTAQEYSDSLPKFEPQPESFKGRLNTPVLAETRISAKRQSELAGIQYFLDGLNVKDWDKDPKKYKTPNSPYAVWTDEGARNMNRKVRDVRKKLAPDERGGTEFDGIALYIVKPQVLKTRFLDLPGTAVGSDFAPGLALWRGRPRLNRGFVGSADPRFSSLVCGRQK